MRKRVHIDPALQPEARMDRMREEIYLLRRTILSLIPEPFQGLIEPPYEFTREEGRRWALKL